MTTQEFIAWFDGYCEHIQGAPTAEQFDRIKKQIAAITTPLAQNPSTYRPWWNALSCAGESAQLGEPQNCDRNKWAGTPDIRPIPLVGNKGFGIATDPQ